MGEWHLGARCTRADVHALLRRALADHLVEPDEPPAPPNFSLHVAEDARNFHQLYRGVSSVVRTRDVRRLLAGLVSYLSAVIEEPDGGTLRLDVLAFVKDGAAILVPGEIRHVLPSIERRLRAKGLVVVDRPWARVDPVAAELVLTPSALSVDWALLDRIGGTDPTVEAGRYPIAGWGFGAGQGDSGPIARALAVTLAGERLVDRGAVSPERALEALARVIRAVEPVGLWADRPEGLVGPLSALAG